MDYFYYNQLSLRDNAKAEPEFETLTFTGDETIDVTEDQTMTVDEIRDYIRNMNARTIQQRENSGNVVGLKPLPLSA